jgi:Arc/MetJ-type ribon-helix-helix transcriptional regulator
MRLHISLDDDLVEQLDRRVGKRRRSKFINEIVRRALDDERRCEDIEAGLGALSDSGHEWDADPAGWVRAQRHSDPTRVG